MMWQSAFSYDKKGPFHIQEDETKEEKEACARDLAERSAARYDNDKVNWELENGIRRLRATSTMPGRKPTSMGFPAYTIFGARFNNFNNESISLHAS